MTMLTSPRRRDPEETLMTSLAAIPLAAPLPELEQAACADYPDPDTFFPSSGDPGFEAKRICAFCPERQPCLQYALTADIGAWGIWGGLTATERARIRSSR